MTLLDQLAADMKEAMKKKDKERLSTIRFLKSSLQNEAIHLGKDLSEDEILVVLSRELKQRKDSLQEFEKAERQDLADKVTKEIEVLEGYMPEQLSEDELSQIVDETLVEVGAKTKSDMGKVMKAIMPKVQGRADGSQVKNLVQARLS
ncbi:uncharacterized protein YqeY [Pullulanibacillus pueri]|uniref:GatB/YqeY domain-containing protein n=1 Tax=Pullulanibacillus pueri TaxID=1437324 RepID=A0A8J2ZXS1_9BACL|nr:GatB/YqeY domain-containing protein [Pullulanibacillus pueri]MBM7683049.1 uncharacterized protein YqeY [Pullulanibacillus pueri]GGH84961.1 hypothetical protein GCM10007096_29240 [Pullulanibacillus pueri]